LSFLLDTNIVSELKRGRKCDPRVAAWHAAQVSSDLFVSVLTLGELRKGVDMLRPRDAARAQLFEGWLVDIESDFQDRIIPIDIHVADRWGRLAATRPLPPIDALLAATALVHDLTLVTRNTRDIASTGVRLLDPFADA